MVVRRTTATRSAQSFSASLIYGSWEVKLDYFFEMKEEHMVAFPLPGFGLKVLKGLVLVNSRVATRQLSYALFLPEVVWATV
jgi:hypothetical protein